jgi:hypothetical protein
VCHMRVRSLASPRSRAWRAKRTGREHLFVVDDSLIVNVTVGC